MEPIKEFEKTLQSEFSPINADGAIVVRKLYNRLPVTKRIMPAVGIEDLEIVVSKINSGQKELERIRHYEDSFAYRALTNGFDNLKRKLGQRVDRMDIMDIFDYQLSNVGDLNQILVGMAIRSSSDIVRLKDIRQEKRQSFISSQTQLKSIDQSFPNFEERRNYLTAQISDLDPHEKPNEYMSAKAELEKINANIKGNSFYLLDAERDRTHSLDFVYKLDLHIDLFESLFYGVMSMAKMTAHYQDQLTVDAIVWRDARDLAQVVSKVSGGVNILHDFSQQLSESYSMVVKDMFNTFDNHPSRKYMKSSSRELEGLIKHIKASQYLKNGH